MPCHTHLKWQYHFEETFDNYMQGKNQLSFMISLKYFNMTNWSVILAYLLWLLWEYLAMHTQSDTLYLQKLSVFTSMEKINFMLFWRYRKDMQTCFGTLGMPTQPTLYYQLVENVDVYLHVKNKVHLSLLTWDIIFYKNLEFYWLTSIGHVTEDPELCQTWDWCWSINNNISFHFRLFARKSNDEIFQKIQKTLFWGYFGIFCPNLDKNELSWKIELWHFLNMTVVFHRAKNQKKLMWHLW